MSALVKAAGKLAKGTKKAAPYILTGTAIVGVGTTAALAVKATPAAMEDLKAATDKKQAETGDTQARLTKAEAVKVAAPHYIPAGISGLITSGCMLLSTHISMKRAAGCAAVATAAQQALNEYSDKVAEKFGAEKEQEVHDELAAEKIRKHASGANTAIQTGNGDHLFFFVPHNVWFRSDREVIRQQLNLFNAELVKCGDGIPENDLLDLLYHGTDEHGDIYGFPALDDRGRRGLVEFRYTDYCDLDGSPNPEYNSRYILNGEAATAIDYVPWSEPVVGYEDF